MNDGKYIWWAWATKNSVMMICWAAIAIYFGKWWLALFAVLFLTSIERREENG